MENGKSHFLFPSPEKKFPSPDSWRLEQNYAQVIKIICIEVTVIHY